MSAAAASKLRLAVLVLIAIVAQTALASDVRVLGVAPDVMVLVAICSGMVAGAETGAVMGFVSGMAADLFLADSPFGLSALTFCLVGLIVGLLRDNVLREGWLLTPTVAFAATAAGVLGFVALGDVVGRTGSSGASGAWVIRVALVEGVWSAALSMVIRPAVARAGRGLRAVERLDGRPDHLPAR